MKFVIIFLLLVSLIVPFSVESRAVNWPHYDVRLGQEDLRISLPPGWDIKKNSLSEFIADKDGLTIRLSHAFTCNKEYASASKKLSNYLAKRLRERNIEKINDSSFSTYKAREIIYKSGWSWGDVPKESWREIEIVDGHGHDIRLSGKDEDVQAFLKTLHTISSEVVVYKLCEIRP